MDTKPITLKVAVDTSTNRVLFVESDAEFVDILLSFLTLPLGTVVRILGKQSLVGCLDNLYGSVENLNTQFLNSEPCAAMLLSPRNTAMYDCKKLSINLDDSETTKYYTCPSFNCISSFYNHQCKCGHKEMSPQELNFFDARAAPDTHDGVFVKLAKFAITDDLVIAPAWDTTKLFDKSNIKDWSKIEERLVTVDQAEVLKLLGRSLLSKTPLTDAFLHREGINTIPLELKPRYSSVCGPKPEEDKAPEPESSRITLKLVMNKNKRLLYAKANHDFVDLLFSFLTFPLGSIESNLGSQSSILCLDNLYESVVNLNSIDCLKKDFKQFLLNPKLPMHFSCKNKLISVEEVVPTNFYAAYVYEESKCRCVSTAINATCPCLHRMNRCLALVNPKESEDGGYLGSSTKYMVTDELVVTPFSIMSAMSLHKRAKGKVDEMDIEIGEEEALSLLKASLTSKAALTDAFLYKTGTAGMD